MRKTFIIVFSLFVFCANLGGEEEDKSLLLNIGDKNLREKTILVSPHSIYSSQWGREVTFEEMIKDLGESRFVYIGESHDSLPTHNIQAKIIQALYEKSDALSIGLEMLPISRQDVLDRWSGGMLSEDEFLREAGWYVHWNFNFGFYKDIFLFARDNKVPIHALNVPRGIITKIRIGGWEALSDEEKDMVPEPDITHEEHRILIRTIFESADLPPQMKGKGLDSAFEGLYRAQSAWDEVMASNAVKVSGKDDCILAVLAGSGHLLYNLGINRRVHEANNLPFRTVVCVIVPEDKESLEVMRSLADYIWALPEENFPVFPSVGLKFKKFKNLENLVIERKPIEGVAKAADFKKGDVVLSVNGMHFTDINELRIYLSQFRWNDEVNFHLMREAQEIDVTLKFLISEKEKSKNQKEDPNK